MGPLPVITVAVFIYCLCNVQPNWLLRKLPLCFILCVCVVTCSGQSGASTLVSSGLDWMALRGLSWSMSVSAGPMASPLTMRWSVMHHSHIMLQGRQPRLNHHYLCARRRVCCTGAMPGLTRSSASTWRLERTEKWCWPTTTWTCSRSLYLRVTSTGVTGQI